MKGIISGFIAALISFNLNNSSVVKVKGEKVITLLAPFVEEITKTFSAFFIGGSIFISHMVFGLVEWYYDYTGSKKAIGMIAGGVSFISHSLFGYITVVLYNITDNLFLGIAASILVHSLWNFYVIKCLGKGADR